jgi:antitoxin component of RelBE/YafQ-DinJ toxin-antitoxin module
MASRTVRARLDDESAAALRFLVSAGMTESQAVRVALAEARAARLTDDALRAQCERLMADPAEVARMRRLTDELEDETVPWPD